MRRRRQALRLLALTSLCAGTAVAAPRIDAITAPADPRVGCAFRTAGTSTQNDRLVLFWRAERGAMKVDGKTIDLEVTEVPCRADCMKPGKSGTQVFRFTGNDGVQATLTKRNRCARGAEVCSGLAAGQARLAVSSAHGKARLQVRNEDCDH